ncbi:MAG: DUF362 domain-containing protein, partial [Anaerolineaceae bacterium]|nr:DUF362 domain-containing protein [Anaerolineaceae bacterium]
MKRCNLIFYLMLTALLLCTAAVSAQEDDPVVLFTGNISSEGLSSLFQVLQWEPAGKTAVVLSTGESERSGFLTPELIGDLVQGLDAVIVESNTAYSGSRSVTPEHYQTAEDRGYTEIAEFQVFDEYGSTELPVEGGIRLKSVPVGSHFGDYDSYVIITRFTGDDNAGYAGAIRNTAFGLASAMGKVRIQSGGLSDTRLQDGGHDEFLEAMAEAGMAVSEARTDNIIYVNVMDRISIDSDSDPDPSEPEMQDIGILVSDDPVALDRACLDLIKNAEGNERFLQRMQELNGEHTLEHAAEIGLGSEEYVLLDVTDGLGNPYFPFEATENKLAELISLPPEEEKAIADMEPCDADHTWAFYIYLIGSDLESMGMDNLADITLYMTDGRAKENKTKKDEQKTADLMRFIDELRIQGMEPSAMLFQPVANADYGSGPRIREDDPDNEGYAAMNLEQMLTLDLQENIKIVIQTGGSKRWYFPFINPNRTQRFLLDSTGMHEVSSVPALDMADPDTLADFLEWGVETYPADHSMVIFWDHGGSHSGYGVDEIYESMLSIRDLHDAFEKAVGSNPEDPYFEAIAFDACLMANIDVAHELYGYAKYLFASEEVEPGTGWSYDLWLQELIDHPEMNMAQVGKAITDSYMEQSTKAYAMYGYITAGTFGVYDLNAAEAVYRAYGEFAKEALQAVIKDPAYLASLTDAANRSVFYSYDAYDVYNTIDLGLFMDNVPEILSDAAAEVKEQLKKAVLYHRGAGYLSESQGLTVYYPVHIKRLSSLSMALNYIYHISDDPAVNALYYYKAAGCLNEEMQNYTESEGFGKPKTLDFSILRTISETEVTADNNGNFSFTLSDEQMALVQDAHMLVAHYDKETGNVTYYGEDNSITMSDGNTFTAAFGGEWLMMNDCPLPLEVIGSTDEYITYTVPMVYNKNVKVNFMLSYHCDTQTVDFLGIRTPQNEADLMGRDLLPMKPHSIYNAVYRQSNLENYSVSEIAGPSITVDENLSFSYQPLPDGKYFAYVIVEDLRSDKYYTPVFEYTLQDGRIINASVADYL